MPPTGGQSALQKGVVDVAHVSFQVRSTNRSAPCRAVDLFSSAVGIFSDQHIDIANKTKDMAARVLPDVA